MALESTTYINGLVATNPTGTDPKSQGDDHIRLVKSAIKNTLPNITGAVTATQDELNLLDGVTATTAELNKIDGYTGSNTELNYAKDLYDTGVTATEFDKLDGVTLALNLLNGMTGGVKDEDNMASNSASSLATQQSIKAYVDNNTPEARTPVVTAETQIFSTTSTTNMSFTKYSFAKSVTNNKDVGYFHIEASATRAPTGNISAIVKVANSSAGTAFVQAEAVGYSGSRDDAANTTRSESYAFLNLSEDPSNSSNWAVWISWSESNTTTREGRVAVCGYM